MIALARERNAAVGGSIATEDEGKYYNRFHFVRPDGTFDVYDKRHLFAYAGEDKEYTAGDRRVVAEYKGVRILLQVCYDLRFPVFSRNRGDFDMIVYVANWPASRIAAWDTLLRARAIENACYVAGVNRTGIDPSSSYNGHTVLLDFKGDTIASACTTGEEAVAGQIDMSQLEAFREKFPVYRDADQFTIAPSNFSSTAQYTCR
jgi:predicted amidohydrolase